MTARNTQRSWAELARTLQGGIAVLGKDGRLAVASDRFLGLAGDLATDDDDLRRHLDRPGPGPGRALFDELSAGVTVDFEHRWVAPSGALTWVEVTVVPSTGVGPDHTAVVFVRDITAWRRAVEELRVAALSITEIEEIQHRRTSRELHDGPVQVLSALLLRLGMVDHDGRVAEIHDRVAAITADLRAAIEQFSTDEPRAAGALLEGWIRPFVGTDRILTVEDRTDPPVSAAALQAAFFFLYSDLQTGPDAPDECLTFVLSNESGGYRLTLESDRPGSVEPPTGHAAARLRALRQYVRSMGGKLEPLPAYGAGHSRSLWLPARSTPGAGGGPGDDAGSVVVTPGKRPATVGFVEDLPPLDDRAWESIVHQAPERVMEFDADDRFMFVSQSYRDSHDGGGHNLLGQPFEAVVPEDSLAQLEPVFQRLDAGESVDVSWERENAFGEVRPVRLRAVPRFDEDGEWAGSLAVVEDLGDTGLLRDLHRAALIDFARTRNLATQSALARLAGPISSIDGVIGELRTLQHQLPDRAGIAAIRIELESLLPRIRLAIAGLTVPDFRTGDLGTLVRGSLESILTDVHLDYTNRATRRLPHRVAEGLFRIAREAVVNAVHHGGATTIAMTLTDDHEAIRLEVSDDGVGVRADDLRPEPGHLGTRVMHERAAELGGRCTIGAAVRGGTVVSVEVPRAPHDGRTLAGSG